MLPIVAPTWPEQILLAKQHLCLCAAKYAVMNIGKEEQDLVEHMPTSFYRTRPTLVDI